MPVNIPDELLPVTAVTQANDSTEKIKPGGVIAMADPLPEKVANRGSGTGNKISSLQMTISDEIKSFPAKSDNHNSSPVTGDPAPGAREQNISKIDFKKDVTIGEREFTQTLIAINTSDNTVEASSEKPGINKFIAKTFRERIFKSPTQEKGSLKAYEVADAGINGLNKIFGWEMSLQKNRDQNGELKSLRFNSKFLKFNTPVKRAQLQP
jgi:hypothetical protein